MPKRRYEHGSIDQRPDKDGRIRRTKRRVHRLVTEGQEGGIRIRIDGVRLCGNKWLMPPRAANRRCVMVWVVRVRKDQKALRTAPTIDESGPNPVETDPGGPVDFIGPVLDEGDGWRSRTFHAMIPDETPFIIEGLLDGGIVERWNVPDGLVADPRSCIRVEARMEFRWKAGGVDAIDTNDPVEEDD